MEFTLSSNSKDLLFYISSFKNKSQLIKLKINVKAKYLFKNHILLFKVNYKKLYSNMSLIIKVMGNLDGIILLRDGIKSR